MGLFLSAKRQQENNVFSECQRNLNSVELTVHNPELKKQIEMIGLTKEDLAVIVCLKPIIAANIDKIVDQFYGNLNSEASLLNIINNNSSIDRLKITLKRHISEMFEGKINEEFITTRERIARVHVKVGLLPKWYLCAFQDLLVSVINLIDETVSAKKEFTIAVKAVTKILNLEQQIVLEAYDIEFARVKALAEEEKVKIRTRVNETAAGLAERTMETNAFIEELSAQSREIAEYANNLSEVAAAAQTDTLTGKDELEEQQRLMNQIQTSTQSISRKMETLEKTANEINGVITIVTSIADQTNLLALNAAIESARAGEFGKGFAVVADEVRKLAEETKKSVSGISHLVTDINLHIEEMANSIKAVSELTAKGSQQMNEMNRFFDSVLAVMNENKDQSEKTKHDLATMAEVIDEVSSTIHHIAESADSLKMLSSEI